jgi:hypothetical protein
VRDAERAEREPAVGEDGERGARVSQLRVALQHQDVARHARPPQRRRRREPRDDDLRVHHAASHDAHASVAGPGRLAGGGSSRGVTLARQPNGTLYSEHRYAPQSFARVGKWTPKQMIGGMKKTLWR